MAEILLIRRNLKQQTINQSVLVHPNTVAMSMKELETTEMAAYKVKTSAFYLSTLTY